ncbi:NAD(P)H-dependent oxidoreductase [Aurantibacillus circumpalustris]|uniref:NAD(P)H-dependent oxidoreductase n=1 Tax=Aurantibacillus circumpalustris TaxID=3036359 RepID=UPI00295ADC4C|nr:NAD(P)H-dependent oxidoreductase [Aurantibacillus circumpalustris]
MKKILVINGHPTKSSFCDSLSKAYTSAASSKGNQLVLLNLYELNFSINFINGYSKKEEPENDILFAQEKIKWADHIVILHPVWWGSVPALLKGFFDATLLPGFAFKYKQKGILWDKLLSGRTGHIIYTSDTPIWIYKYFYKAPSLAQVKDRTLGFCGIKNVKVTGIGPVKNSTQGFREKWIEKIEELGRQVA